MKITKTQLKRIIREEKAKLTETTTVDSKSSGPEAEFERALFGLFDAYVYELTEDRPGIRVDVVHEHSIDKILALVNNLLGL